jgi:hypothetical protein
MRIGQNPAKFVQSVSQPARITATVVCCIPFLSGFYEKNLDVLKACISSLDMNRESPIDLMVFDNHSCRQVRSYLYDTYEQGIIQYLILSDTNIGKIGAWNFMFGASQGEYIAFSDSDVFFRPGWLSESLKLFKRFPNVGMVTGRPTRTPVEYLSSTLSWGRSLGDPSFKEGTLMDWETFVEHTRSLGHSDDAASKEYNSGKDYLLTYDGSTAFAGASHFQFIARKKVLNEIFPLPSEKPMRGEPMLDKTVNDLGYLRLSIKNPLVLHMGNRVPDFIQLPNRRRKPKRWLRSFVNIRFFRYILMHIYGAIFRIYFNNVD